MSVSNDRCWKERHSAHAENKGFSFLIYFHWSWWLMRQNVGKRGTMPMQRTKASPFSYISSGAGGWWDRMLQNQPEKEEMNGNMILNSTKVREVIQNKRRLVEVPYTVSECSWHFQCTACKQHSTPNVNKGGSSSTQQFQAEDIIVTEEGKVEAGVVWGNKLRHTIRR